jgi:hypothetical protein
MVRSNRAPASINPVVRNNSDTAGAIKSGDMLRLKTPWLRCASLGSARSLSANWLVHAPRTADAFFATSGSWHFHTHAAQKTAWLFDPFVGASESSPAIESTSRNGEVERIADSFSSAIAVTSMLPRARLFGEPSPLCLTSCLTSIHVGLRNA